MGMVRKLEDVHRKLDLLKRKGRAGGFLTNIGNADELCGLIEDVHDAAMEYQVCNHKLTIPGDH